MARRKLPIGSFKRGIVPLARTIIDRHLSDRSDEDAYDITCALAELLLDEHSVDQRTAVAKRHAEYWQRRATQEQAADGK